MATAARDALLAEFDHAIATTKKPLERLPGADTALAWRPHPKSTTLGGLCTHIANILRLNGVAVPAIYGPSADEGQ